MLQASRHSTTVRGQDAQAGEAPCSPSNEQSLPENGHACTSQQCALPASDGIQNSSASMPRSDGHGAANRTRRGRRSKQRPASAGQAPAVSSSREEPGASDAAGQQLGSIRQGLPQGHLPIDQPAAGSSLHQPGHDQLSRQDGVAGEQQAAQPSSQPHSGQTAKQHPGAGQSAEHHTTPLLQNAVVRQAADQHARTTHDMGLEAGADAAHQRGYLLHASRPVAVPQPRQLKLSPRSLPCSLPDLSACLQQQDGHAFR